MLRSGVLELSVSPLLSLVVLVKKKNRSLRFCVDYQVLNAVTRKDYHPLPRIDALIDEHGPATTFTTLDARAAYWSIKVEPPALRLQVNSAIHQSTQEQPLYILTGRHATFAVTTSTEIRGIYGRYYNHGISFLLPGP